MDLFGQKKIEFQTIELMCELLIFIRNPFLFFIQF